jgi:hypothetical protein
MQAGLFLKELIYMNKQLKLFLLFSFLFFGGHAQKTSISFINKTYIGDTIHILKEKDFITGQMDTMISSSVNFKGEWKINLSIKEPVFVRLPLYRNEVWLLIEPNKSYQIRIPNKQLLTVEDSLNSFFLPISFYAEILNHDSSECNKAIMNLNYCMDTLYQKHIKNIHFKIKRKTIDSLVNLITNTFSYVSSKYFHDYLYYKIAMLKYLSYEREQNFIIKYYFNDKPVLIHNTSYQELFNQTFSDYLSYYATTHWGEGVKDAIEKYKSPVELRQTLKRNPAFTNDTLIDLVILKGLHDAYYTNDLPNKIKFPKASIITLLDSMITLAKSEKLKEIAQNIQRKIKQEELIISFDDYTFKDIEGNDIFLRNFRGKYLYIMVVDFRSYEFLTLLKQEKASLDRFSKEVTIINIVLSPQKERLIKMIKEHSLTGHFLFCTNESNFKKQLKIKALPIFMIWDPRGNIINANAPSPNERIIPYFMQLIKN